ncbi:P40 [Trabala vishnou gigantina nucleopolyhedrovirus]|uniref:P40 n=1 Tax=Trabala vishnou gigantina nucleopolyhedrovirus TaxID=2863583 RepID=UPI002481F7F8|nr:P40 [Trabala vishnou gigantina nucleopolyhedrovirus]QYC92685.1 P40 [Trabala vishnou gigantina nucleopolyhedrovirus]
MTSVDLFNEMVILRDKIDPQMQMDIWIRLFDLLPESADSINLTFDEFIEFLTNVAQAASNRNINENVALASEHSTVARGGEGGGGGNVVADNASRMSTATRTPRGILNVFNRGRVAGGNVAMHDNASVNVTHLRKTCQKVLQYYTLSSTTSSEFKVSDLVCCLLYLAKTPSYSPLFNLLEQAFGDTNECMPNLTADQMYHVTNLLRNLLNLPSTIIDYDNVKLLRTALNKIMNYPLTRFPRIIIVPSTGLSKDKRCSLEDLILERADKISRLEPQQYVDNNESSRIPFCDDEEFINELLKITDDFSLPRMFYNAANSIFYTTMENYAITNCKFDINDYNNMYKTMDSFKELKEKCGLINKNPDVSDTLNIYLNGATSLSKKKKY